MSPAPFNRAATQRRNVGTARPYAPQAFCAASSRYRPFAQRVPPLPQAIFERDLFRVPFSPRRGPTGIYLFVVQI